MNRDEYAAAVRAAYEAPLRSTATPEGQKFHIGQKVRMLNDFHAIYGVREGDVVEIEYSDEQKYGGGYYGERRKDYYSIIIPPDGRHYLKPHRLAWIMEYELAADSSTEGRVGRGKVTPSTEAPPTPMEPNPSSGPPA